jgi:homeobox-leucine zipper protein
MFYLALQTVPVFIFANQAGLDMLETTLVALQDITLDKIFNDSARKNLVAYFSKLIQEVISSSLTLLAFL